MTTSHPITRAELREELDRSLQPYATRDSLEHSLRQYATREDLERALQQYATKEDLANLKYDLYRWMFGSVATVAAIVMLIDRLWS